MTTVRPVELLGGQVYVQVTYESTTGVVASVVTHNATGAPKGRVRLSLLAGTIILDNVPVPAGDTTTAITGSRTITTLNVYATA